MLWRGRRPRDSDTAAARAQQDTGRLPRLLDETVKMLRPRIVVAVGAGTGGSALQIAATMQQEAIAGVVIAVNPADRATTSRRNWLGRRSAGARRAPLPETFAATIAAAGLHQAVLPVWLDAARGAELLRRAGIEAELIHIDIEADAQAVGNALALWWPLLRPGGALIWCQYDPADAAGSSGRTAFDRFCVDHGGMRSVAAPEIRLLRNLPAAAPPPGAAEAPEAVRTTAGEVHVQAFGLPETLDYIGEFGPELILFLPFVTWLARQGMLRGRRIATYRGMRCFYEDLDCAGIVEKPDKREYVRPQDRPFWLPVKNEHDFDTRRASPFHLYPDLRARFGAMQLGIDIGSPARPLLIIHNKHNLEWKTGPINCIPLDALDAIFRVLKHDFTIVYIRHGMAPPEGGFVDDHNDALPGYDDAALLLRHPEVHGFDRLFDAYRAASGDDDVNRFKAMLLARCHRFISSQGGGAHQIAMFSGSLLVVLHRRGFEEQWAYYPGYYSFLAPVPPVLAVCRTEAELMRALVLFGGSVVVNDRCLPGPAAAPILAALSPATISQRSRPGGT